MLQTNSQQLPHLDALRFWAFTAVFIAHSMHLYLPDMEQYKLWESLRNSMQVGVLGVNFFFVLSGFLITRLLLIEKDKHQNIQLVKFYIRRCLRIWPLYFLILLLALLSYQFTQNDTHTNWWYYLSFTGNFHNLYQGAPYSPALANLWTLGVEEQFYILWPLLLLFANKRSVVWLSALIILQSLLFRYMHIHQSATLYFHTLSISGDFAIGALGAWLSMYYPLQTKNFFQKNSSFSWIIYPFTVALFIYYDTLFSISLIMLFERMIFAALFLFIILEQVYAKEHRLKAGHSPYINYLGKISYGLYMYHAFGLQLSYKIFQYKSAILSPWIYMILHPLFAFGITLLISHLSYKFFEKRFLILKQRFSTK